MKFRNITEDARDIPALGITVEPGETTPDLGKEAAAGLLHQDESWHAVGDDARAAQQAAIAAAAEPPESEAPAAKTQRPRKPRKPRTPTTTDTPTDENKQQGDS